MTRQITGKMRSLLPLLSLATMARALYFYVDVTTPKCFFEELPKDTLVVGHYSAEEWNDQRHMWEKHDGISIYISVDVCPPFHTFPSHNNPNNPPPSKPPGY